MSDPVEVLGSTAVVLAGGLGTRISTVLGETPKALAPLAGQPLLWWKLKELSANGIVEAVLLLRWGADLIEESLRDIDVPIHVSIVRDGDAPLGTGGALSAALPGLPPTFFVTYGDSLLDMTYDKMRVKSQTGPFRNILAVTTRIGPADHGNCSVSDGQVHEYSKVREGDFAHMDYGLLLLDREDTRSVVADVSRPFDLGVVIDGLARTGLLGAEATSDDYWEIGTPASYARAKSEFSRRIGGQDQFGHLS